MSVKPTQRKQKSKRTSSTKLQTVYTPKRSRTHMRVIKIKPEHKISRTHELRTDSLMPPSVNLPSQILIWLKKMDAEKAIAQKALRQSDVNPDRRTVPDQPCAIGQNRPLIDRAMRPKSLNCNASINISRLEHNTKDSLLTQACFRALTINLKTLDNFTRQKAINRDRPWTGNIDDQYDRSAGPDPVPERGKIFAHTCGTSRRISSMFNTKSLKVKASEVDQKTFTIGLISTKTKVSRQKTSNTAGNRAPISDLDTPNQTYPKFSQNHMTIPTLIIEKCNRNIWPDPQYKNPRKNTHQCREAHPSFHITQQSTITDSTHHIHNSLPQTITDTPSLTEPKPSIAHNYIDTNTKIELSDDKMLTGIGQGVDLIS